METLIVRILIPASALVSGLVAAYVSLQNRALLAEVRREIAEMENRLFVRINGTYVRAAECKLREDLLIQRVNAATGGVRPGHTRSGS